MLQSNWYLYKKIILIFILTISVFFTSEAQVADSTSLQLEEALFTLQRDQRASKIWWNSWLGLYTAGTIVQTGIALNTDDKALKQDMYLGAATTFLGAGFQLITPVVKIDKNFFSNIDKLSPDERLTKQNKAYKLLEQSSAYSTEGRSWKTHALTGAANIGGGLITWFGFKRTWKDGLINFAINTAITETQIWSQPIIAKKALKKYSSQYLSGNYIPNYKPRATFSACACGTGVQLKMVF